VGCSCVTVLLHHGLNSFCAEPTCALSMEVLSPQIICACYQPHTMSQRTSTEPEIFEISLHQPTPHFVCVAICDRTLRSKWCRLLSTDVCNTAVDSPESCPTEGIHDASRGAVAIPESSGLDTHTGYIFTITLSATAERSPLDSAARRLSTHTALSRPMHNYARDSQPPNHLCVLSTSHKVTKSIS
jgi:hypothetical protein